MTTHFALARVLLLAPATLLLQANRKTYVKLPGHKIRDGMKCPDPNCSGRVSAKNGVYQCARCYVTVEPS